MKLVFYAQVKRGIGTSADALEVIKTTKGRPSSPEGSVIKFDIDVPETVFEPEVKASLVALDTVTEQTIAELRSAVKK